MKGFKDRSTDRLGTAPIGRLLFEFALPCIAAELVYSSYNIIDTAILGWFVGDSGIAVVTLAMPLQNILMAFAFLIGMGGNALAAIQLGEGKIDKVELTLGNSVMMMIIMSAIISVLGFIFIDPLLAFIGTPDSLWHATKDFVLVTVVFDIAISVGLGVYTFLRTAGKPMLALLMQTISVIICLVCNLLFVGAMGMGVMGSALATVCGEGGTAILVIIYFTRAKGAPFHLKLSCMRLDAQDCATILKLGFASFAMQVGSTVVNVVFNHVVGIWGPTHEVGVEGCLSGIGVSNRVSWFICSVFIGVAQGMQPVVGFNIGAGKFDRALKALKWACVTGMLIGCFFFAIIHIFPDQILYLFNISSDLEEFAKWALFLNMLFCPLVAFQIIGGSYFQSSGQPLKAGVIELLRQVILLTPFYLIFPHFNWLLNTTPVDMILIACPCSDFLSVSFTAFLVFKEVRKLHIWMAEQKDDSTQKLTEAQAI